MLAEGPPTKTPKRKFLTLICAVPPHLLFAALYPPLFLYSVNMELTAFADTYYAFGLTMGITVAVFAVALAIFRNAPKAALITTVILAALFLFGQVNTLVTDVFFGGERYKILFLIIWAITAYALLAWIFWFKSRFPKTTRILNVVTGTMVLLPLITIGVNSVSSSDKSAAAKLLSDDDRSLITPLTDGGNRDIYFLIFDRYAASRTLSSLYKFDNQPFLNELRQRGFFIAENSVSNYLKTSHSLASTLNIDYLDKLAAQVGKEEKSWLPLNRQLKNFRVQRILRNFGYQYLHMGSWWEPTRRNRHADRNYVFATTNEFAEFLLESSAIRAFTENFEFLGMDWSNKRGAQCRRVKAKFARLKTVPEIKEKTFTFAHMLIPHAPFFLDANGNCLSPDQRRKRSISTGYLGQLQYANTRKIEIVDTLIAKSEVPPIIIIQADEGPFPDRYRRGERDFDWRQATPTELRQKVRILNAMYLPGTKPAELHPGITPINTFPIVFNTYFGGKFDLFPDKSYAFVGHYRPYDFFEITDIVR